jgi:hypothetical protein
MGYTGSGTNLYAYAGNDPVNLTDPTGMWSVIQGAVAFLFGGAEGGGLFGGGIGYCASGGFFVCATVIGGSIYMAIDGTGFRNPFSGGGGGKGGGPAGPPPSLTGDEMSAEAAQGQAGYKPQLNDYTPSVPVLRFDSRNLLDVGDSGIVDVQFWDWNYCGPGNNGGPAWLGTTDYCCELHDLCYGSGGLSGKDVLEHFHGKGASALQRGRDALLCGCVNAFGNISGPYDLLMRQGIRSVFCY